mmetsp:Transcript_28903/g.69053  ORF Transcript_28903/g.69053 Transcript_28903/m.69053 type:complete len:206 (-) Transcript_28903:1717-2334(-)
MGSGAAVAAVGAASVVGESSRFIPMRSASESAAAWPVAGASTLGEAVASEDCSVLAPVAFMYSASVSGGMCSTSLANNPPELLLNSLSNSHERCCTSRNVEVVCFPIACSTCGRVSGTCAAILTSAVTMYSLISESQACVERSTSSILTASAPVTRSGSSPSRKADPGLTRTSPYSPMTHTATRMSEAAARSSPAQSARYSARTM